MKAKETRKIRVSTYARQKEISPQTVYGWIKAGKVESEEIDGVMFVIVEK